MPEHQQRLVRHRRGKVHLRSQPFCLRWRLHVRLGRRALRRLHHNVHAADLLSIERRMRHPLIETLVIDESRTAQPAVESAPQFSSPGRKLARFLNLSQCGTNTGFRFQKLDQTVQLLPISDQGDQGASVKPKQARIDAQ